MSLASLVFRAPAPLPLPLINPSKPTSKRPHTFPLSTSPSGHNRRQPGLSPPARHATPPLSDGGEGGAHVGDAQGLSSDTIDGGKGDAAAKSFSSKELMQKLRRYGVAGVLSYGLLNTIYYLVTFLLVWFYFAPAPGRLGYSAAVQRFLKVMAMVWAGSQVTKIIRAGGALALAPIVERGLSWFTIKFRFKSEGKAFAAIVFLCFGLALFLFFGLTLLWA